MMQDLEHNKTIRILRDAEQGGYGVVASIVYARVMLQKQASEVG